jgi:hypothetical protein
MGRPARGPVTLTIDALPGVRPGTYVVNLTARSTGIDPPVARTVPVMVTVFELDVAVLPLDLSGELVVLTGNASWTVPDGTEVHIELTIENPRRTAVTGVVVRLDRIGPAGVTVPVDSWELELGPNATRALSTSWRAKGAGVHRLEATVILADQSDSTNDLASASVTVTRPGGSDDGDVGMYRILVLVVTIAVAVVAGVYVFLPMRERMRGG